MSKPSTSTERPRRYSIRIRLSPEAIAAVDLAKQKAERKHGISATDQSIGERGFREFCELHGVDWPAPARSLRQTQPRHMRAAAKA